MHQAITWTNVDPDLCHHMVSLGHNGLTHWGWMTPISIPLSTCFERSHDSVMAFCRFQSVYCTTCIPPWFKVNTFWPSDVICWCRSGSFRYDGYAVCWTNVDLSSMPFCDTHLRPILQEVLKISNCKICLKITLVKLLPHFQGIIELINMLISCIVSTDFMPKTQKEWTSVLKLKEKQTYGCQLPEEQPPDSIPQPSVYCLTCGKSLKHPSLNLNPVSEQLVDNKQVPEITWEDLGRHLVSSMGTEVALDLLNSASIPQNALTLQFYDACIKATSMDQKQRWVTGIHKGNLISMV